MIRHNTINSWTLTWLSVVLAIFIGFVAIVTPMEAATTSFDIKGPMFRIVDVRSAQGRLVLEVQHFLDHPEYDENNSVETWFQEIYAFEGKEEWKRSKVIDQVTGLPYMSDGSLFEPTEWVEGPSGEVIPVVELPGGWSSFTFNQEGELVSIDNDAGAVDLSLLEPGLHYSSSIFDTFGQPHEFKSDPEGNNIAFYRAGLDWMFNDSPKLTAQGILDIITRTHQQRLEQGYEGSKGRKVLPQVTHPPNSKEQEGADSLASRFEYLKNRLYIQDYNSQKTLEYLGTDKVPGITPYHERLDLRTINSKSYIVDDYHLQTEYQNGVHYRNDEGELIESSYTFSKDPDEDIWKMETAPFYRVHGTESYIDILSPVGNYGARWYAPSKLNYETTYVWYEYDGLIWKYLLDVSGLKFEAGVTERRGYREYDFTFLPLGTAEPLRVDSLGNLVSGGGDLGFNPTGGIRFWDYIEEGEAGSILIPDADPEMVVPRAIIYTNSPETHLASEWAIVDDYTVRFSFDDTIIPDEAFPYIIDPAVEMACRTVTPGCHDNLWQYNGLYENSPSTATYTDTLWQTGVWNGYQYVELLRIGTGEYNIPPGSIITSVSLILVFDSTPEQGSTAYRSDGIRLAEMKKPWSYMSASWNSNGIGNVGIGGSDWDSAGASTAGVDYYSTNIVEAYMQNSLYGNIPGANQKLEIRDPKLTETVQAWMDGTRPNNGWRMSLTTLCPHVPGNGCNYTYRIKTHFHAWTNDQPTMRIMYRSPMATTCGAVKSTFYSQPSTSTTAFDGYTRNNLGSADFATHAKDLTSTASNDSGVEMYVGVIEAGSTANTEYQSFYRSIVGFDTSGLPDDAEMVSGEMKFVIDQVYDDMSGAATISHNAGANNGGDAIVQTATSALNGGGGGGMAATGGNSTTTTVGVGGAGLGSTLVDGSTTRYYGPGGNGGSVSGDNTTAAPTNGGVQGVAPTSGAADGGDAPNGYGGGGGGAATENLAHASGGAKVGGRGGDGTLIVRYTSGTPLATGGIISSYGGYQVHHFIYDGNPDYFDLGSNTVNLELFMVGGGGGGGASGEKYVAGGGGGGGNVRTLNLNNQTGAHKVTIGKGGLGGGQNNSGYQQWGYYHGQGHFGTNTNFGEHSSPGGGGGGSFSTGSVGVQTASGSAGGGGTAWTPAHTGGISEPDGFYMGWVGMMHPYNGQQATTIDNLDHGTHHWKFTAPSGTVNPAPAYTDWIGSSTLDENANDHNFTTFTLTDAGLGSIKTDTTSWFQGVWDEDYRWPHGLTNTDQGYNLNAGDAGTWFRVDIYTSEAGVSLGPKLELYWNYPDIKDGQGNINPCITTGGSATTGRTISIFYPDADPETSSWDAHGNYSGCGTVGVWDNCTRPTSFNPAGVGLWDDYYYSGIRQQMDTSAGYGQHQVFFSSNGFDRAFFNWDTSAIPDTNTIVGGQIYLAAYGITRDALFTDIGFGFVKAQFASSTGMSGSDWDQQGYLGTGDWSSHMVTPVITEEYWYNNACWTVSSAVSCGTTGHAGSYDPGVDGYWVRVPLNDTGLGHINKTGNTGMMAAYMNDIQKDFQYAGSSGVTNLITWSSADEISPGGDSRPFLVVEHEGADPEVEYTDIQAGGKTIEYDIRNVATPNLPAPGGWLRSPQFVAAGATFDAQRQNFIDLMVGDGNGGGNWNDVKGSIPVTAVVRTNEFKVTVTLPALPGYNTITSDTSETITLQVPGTAIYDTSGITNWQEYNPPAPPGFKISKPGFNIATATPTGGWKHAAAQFTVTGAGVPSHPFTGSAAFKFTKSGESDITCSSVSGGGSSLVVQCDTSSAVTTGAYDAVLTSDTGTTLSLSANNSFFQGWSSAVSGGGFSESGSDYGIFTHSASPYFTVQAFDQVEKEWGTASGVPTTIPGAAGKDGTFSSDKTRLVVSSATTTNPVIGYEFDSTTGVIGSAAAPVPNVVTNMNVFDVDFSYGDNVVGMTTDDGDYIYAYDVDTSAGIGAFWGSQITAPATLPAAPAQCSTIDFNSDATYVAVGCNKSPYLFVYAFDNDATPSFGAKVADPTVSLPSGNVESVQFSPDDTKIAVGVNGSPYLEIYTFDPAGSGYLASTPVSPSGIPATVNGVAWDTDAVTGDTLIAVAHNDTPYVSVYPFNNTTNVFGDKLSDPSTLPTGNATSIGFHPNPLASDGSSDVIYVGTETSPYISSYNFTGYSDSEYQLYRYMLNFDTSYLPDDAVINKATLSLYPTAKGAGSWQMLLLDGAIASEPLVAADYDHINWNSGTQITASAETPSSWTLDQYRDIILNNYTFIDATGISQILLRHENDHSATGTPPSADESVTFTVGNSSTFPPTCLTNTDWFDSSTLTDSQYNLCNSDNVPKLAIEYTSASTGSPGTTISNDFTLSEIGVNADGTYTFAAMNKGPVLVTKAEGATNKATEVGFGRLPNDSSDNWNFLTDVNTSAGSDPPIMFNRSTKIFSSIDSLLNPANPKLHYELNNYPTYQMLDRGTEGLVQNSIRMDFPNFDNLGVVSTVKTGQATSADAELSAAGIDSRINPSGFDVTGDDLGDGIITPYPGQAFFQSIEQTTNMPYGSIRLIAALVVTIMAVVAAYIALQSVSAAYIAGIITIITFSFAFGGVFAWWMLLMFALAGAVFIFSRRAYV